MLDLKPLYEMTDEEIIVEHEAIDFDPEEGSRSDALFTEMIARGLAY